MEQPEGFKLRGKEHLVIRLKKALYRLKQAGLAWWRTLSKSLEEDFGFKHILLDAGIFIHQQGNKFCNVVMYVDDAIFCGPNEHFVNDIKDKFMHKWECRDLGHVKEFLHMCITKIGHLVKLDQNDYLDKVLQCFNMQDCKSAPTLLPAGYYPEPSTDEREAAEYCQKYQVWRHALLDQVFA